MGREPGTYNFGKYTTEDTIKAKTFTITRTPDGGSASPEETPSSATFTVRNSETTAVAHTATSGSGLTIAGNVITVEKFSAPKQEGTWKYDLELVFSNGDRITYVKGTIITEVGVTRL